MATDISFHLTGGMHVVCHAYDDGGPILAIHGEGLHFSMSPLHRADVQPEDVRAARALLAAMVDYVDQCQRWCPDTHDDNTVVIDTDDSAMAGVG
ncbi:hypothetical protein GCM10009765_32700 [Fodinicola feengrottensis]|uniref:DUF1488 family protein n=1 Tax=Fodinicola feengrottensis TaxID=435914 RepID=A0ABN2H2T4_9ACTN